MEPFDIFSTFVAILIFYHASRLFVDFKHLFRRRSTYHPIGKLAIYLVIRFILIELIAYAVRKSAISAFLNDREEACRRIIVNILIYGISGAFIRITIKGIAAVCSCEWLYERIPWLHYSERWVYLKLTDSRHFDIPADFLSAFYGSFKLLPRFWYPAKIQDFA